MLSKKNEFVRLVSKKEGESKASISHQFKKPLQMGEPHRQGMRSVEPISRSNL